MGMQPAFWTKSNLDIVCTVLKPGDLQKLMACPEGQWASCTSELGRAVKSKLGCELFGGPFSEILEEVTADAIASGMADFFAALKPDEEVTLAMVERAIRAVLDQISKQPAIETLKDRRKARG